jgi:hypothetical protein
MKISVTCHNKTISIESDSDDMTGSEFMENLIIPILLAMEYHPDTVDDITGEKYEVIGSTLPSLN